MVKHFGYTIMGYTLDVVVLFIIRALHIYSRNAPLK